jgi:hypothetical protein
MKITLNTSMDSNDLPRHRLVINGKDDVTIQDLSECPEDAHIGRDLVDGKDIIKYIKMGYDAAKNGEELEIETVQDPEYD